MDKAFIILACTSLAQTGIMFTTAWVAVSTERRAKRKEDYWK